MTKVLIDVTISDTGWTGALGEAGELCRNAAAAAFQAAADKNAAEAEVSILLTGDDQVRELNRDYRHQDKPTNVLSFANLDGDEFFGAAPVLLGDIVIAYGISSREAKDENKTLADHLTHLVIHGMLHLLGHDHENDDEAGLMEALEIRILAGLDIADPYNPTDKTGTR